MPNESGPHKTAETDAAKQTWEPMKLTYLGHISELVQGGGGKSGSSADSGDISKPPGMA